MRYPALLLFFMIAATAFGQVRYGNNGRSDRNRVVGNGEVTSQERDTPDFDEIQTCCKLRVEVSRSSNHSVRVEGESNLLEFVRTEVSGDRLKIYFEDGTNLRSKQDIIIYVGLPELEFVSAGSGADVVTTSTFTGDELELRVSSGGWIEAAYEGERLAARASSGGKIAVSGSGRMIDVHASSGASIRATDYSARVGEAAASSGAGVHVNVSDELEADASSGGRVRYRGQPDNLDSNAGSGGSVRKE